MPAGQSILRGPQESCLEQPSLFGRKWVAGECETRYIAPLAGWAVVNPLSLSEEKHA
jgi:hypothetical protein